MNDNYMALLYKNRMSIMKIEKQKLICQLHRAQEDKTFTLS